ncbi:MAG: hypothetical protein CMM30_01190 [Rhodospirillaceae bacterium]|nr:hypothetical protein [Rhodospirillaceae bacterium]
MMDPNKFRHDISRYERPNRKFRCGRAAEWGKPCEFGPDNSGKCGGIYECQPAQVGDRFECRRSTLFGGPCDNGPGSDGKCSQHQPPCRPRRSIRSLRGLMAISAFAIVISVIALMLTLGSDGSGHNVISSAGPLTDGHANFTSSSGCVACHEPHAKDAGEWFLAAFEENNISKNCLNCHTFVGEPFLAHNISSNANKTNTHSNNFSCIACHSEHKGEDFDITAISDAKCNTCHEREISSFANNHPNFADDFPHDQRTAIRFDHSSHITQHFKDQRLEDIAPTNCTSCHEVSDAVQSVKPVGYQTACASCHNDAIPRRELVLLRLPEFDDNFIDLDFVSETCGPTLEAWEEIQDNIATVREAIEAEELDMLDEEILIGDEEEYEPVSFDEPAAISSYLLRTPIDDSSEYTEPLQTLIVGLLEDGSEVLEETIAEAVGAEGAKKMLSGLSPTLTREVACAWASNEEYESPSDPNYGGWYAEGVELKYKPIGHGDPVVRAWINFGALSVLDDDEDVEESGEFMRDELLNPKEGFGACTKCHSVSKTETNPLHVQWNFNNSKSRPHTFYSHGAHLNILNPSGINLADPEAGCQTCHKLNVQANYGASFSDNNPHIFESNFDSIDKETCTQCHNEGQVRQDCQLCHLYHNETGFNLRVTNND